METDQAAADRNQRVLDGKACFDAALAYLALGWSTLALCPPDHAGVGRVHGKDCKSPGKAPWGAWKDFQERLPTEQELREKWQDNPTLNVGMALGPVSGLLSIDVDGPGGEEALARISGGILPQTLEFTTPRGGRHLLYRIPAGITLRNTYEKPGANQEVRFQAKGGQTVMPPSRHENGGQYIWRDGCRPGEIEPAVAPDWLVKRLQQTTSTRTSNGTGNGQANGRRIPQGGRNDFLTSLAGSMRRRGMSEEAIHAALLVENEARCDPPLESSEVKKIASSVVRYAPADDAGRLFDHSETGYDIILRHFRERYDPVFRRGMNIYSSLLGCELGVRDATFGASIELIEALAAAVDAPKYPDGTVKRDSLPSFFSKWSKSAWMDLVGSLVEEPDCAEISRPACEDFETMLRASMSTMVPLGYTYEKNGEQKVERRSLIDWCHLFAKPGRWKGIRSYYAWTRKDDTQLRIGIRVEVFGQICGRFFQKLGQNKFSRLCDLYGLGVSKKILGQRAVELAQPFIESMIARMDDLPYRENTYTDLGAENCP